MTLKTLFRAAAAHLFGGPVVQKKIDGFDVSLDRQDNGCFVFRIRANGQNPEYPAQDEPVLMSFRRKENPGSGTTKAMQGPEVTVHNSARYVGFELVEVFNNGKDFVGRYTPDHHGVILRADIVYADGQTGSAAMGGWVRKSDQEKPDWKKLGRGPMMM